MPFIRVVLSSLGVACLVCACGGDSAEGVAAVGGGTAGSVPGPSAPLQSQPLAGRGASVVTGGAAAGPPAATSGSPASTGPAGMPAAGAPSTGGSAGQATPPAAGSGKPPEPPTDLSAELYDDAKLPRFDIELPAASMNALREAPDTYVRGSLRYGNETVADIGVRIKGEGSLRTLDEKAAFKLKFDEFVDKQEFRGLRRMTLNNMVEDPSFVAERLAYLVYRSAKLPAPRCNSALVYLNGMFLGVYANVEAEDKTFLRRWFKSDSGNLYEEGQSDFVSGAENSFDLETNEDTNDRSDLRALIAAIQRPDSQTPLADWGPLLDVPHFLRFTAAEAAVNQWDMYAYTLFWPNNFRLYHDPDSNKFVFLPWGMDMSMKPFRDSGRPHISIYGLAHSADRPNAMLTAGILFQRCVANAECKSRYTEAVRSILGIYEGLQLESVAARYYAQIKDQIAADPRKEYTQQEIEAGYQSLLSTIRTRAAAIRKDIGGP